MTNHEQSELHDMKNRLARIEARLAQLMLHMGLDPTVRKYSEPRQFSDNGTFPLPLRKSR